MSFAEVVVNIPIRRTYAQHFDSADRLPADSDEIDGENSSANPRFQTFHYTVPNELDKVIRPGHLIWVPFGSREVQGVVVALASHAPVETKAIQRLARPDPVLTSDQLNLARWIADFYVASLSETLKLFLPPGLLAKADDHATVKVKRELQVNLLLESGEAMARLVSLGRDTPQVRVLTLFQQAPGQRFSKSAIMEGCRLKSESALKTLQTKGLLVTCTDSIGLLELAVDAIAVDAVIEKMHGVSKYRAVIQALARAGRPLWRSELYNEVDTSLADLRALQRIGVVSLDEHVRFRDPLAGRAYGVSSAPPLTSEQAAVWKRIRAAAFGEEADARDKVCGHSAPRYLLHGVTGSGKTEIYLQAMAETLARGRQAIVLVPEIALTPQTVERFAARFPGRVTVIHSKMSQGERYDVWRYIRDGHFDVVVGPRSAIFAPFSRLGLIVIDEEHEVTYKQNAEEWGSFTVFYDARTVALQMAQRLNIPLILGSATPSLERYYAAQSGDLELLEMSSRVLGHGSLTKLHMPQEADHHVGSEGAMVQEWQGDPAAYAEMPPVEIVDMRQELRAGNRNIFSRSLQAELHSCIDAGEQAILFLNRRGTSTFVLCRDCGHVQSCVRCETPLTHHERVQTLICHRCNRRYPIPEVCPECDSKRIKYFGSGTQRIEEAVTQIEPRARLLRWDADTASGKGRHEEILAEFARHEADVLVGTQMIAKGLDLPKVTLVGVVAADVGLFLPDFRSSERTFQLLTQVAGRAGRSLHGGRVVVQTYSPDHYAIQAAAHHDYAAFYARELMFRREHRYPPVDRMARLIYWDRKLDKVQSETASMLNRLAERIHAMGIEGEGAALYGPAPAFFARYRGYYRWQILIRMANPVDLLRPISYPFGWRIDIDPMSIL